MQPDDTAWPILSGSFEPFRFRGQSGLGGVLERLGLRDSPRVHAPAAFDRKERGVAIVNGHIIVPNTPRQSASSCRQRSCWPTKSLSEGGTRWPRRPPDDCFREAYLRCSASQRNTGGTGPHCSCNPLAAWSVLQPGRGSPSRCWFRLTVAHSERQQSQRRNSNKCEGEFARHDSPPLAGQGRMCASPSWPTNASCFYEPFHTSPNAQRPEKPQSTADSLSLLAQSGHPRRVGRCPLLGVKRTRPLDDGLSAVDPKRTRAGRFCCDALASTCYTRSVILGLEESP